MDTTVSALQKHRLHGFVLFSVLAALLSTLFLEALDNTIVGPALPHIIHQFQGADRYSWVPIAYLLTSTIAIPIVGKFSDQFGRKWFLLSGASMFLLGSLLCGLSQNMDQLIAFRGLQGLGAGIGMTLVATIIGDIFPPHERAKWQMSVNIVYAFANLLGPGLGGWFTDHGPLLAPFITDTTRWRWIFYLNLPLGIIALTMLLMLLPATLSECSHHPTRREALRRIDIAGSLLCTVVTTCLLLGLTWGSSQTYEWASPQVGGMLGASIMFSFLFLLIERHALEPILPLHLFRNQIFAADAVLALLVYMILLGLAIYLPLFLQGVLGISATSAGVSITPFLISVTVGATLSGWLIAIRKHYQAIIIVGTFIMTLGVFFLTQMTPTTDLLIAVIFMVMAGLGIGSIFSVLYLAAQNVLPLTQLGVGSAVVRYLGQVGSTLGVALVGTVVNQSLTDASRKTIETLAVALQHGFLTILVFCGMALLAACFLKDTPTGSLPMGEPAHLK
ncbi:MAG TPA: MDR family MFS transporter [Ktedonobacteraceae bacterium]|jgi:EmrB/QacA subfamily drug resistance transporter|nr:MDR family MFS transporter [Ktedonobacteraceae bacterium]